MSKKFAIIGSGPSSLGFISGTIEEIKEKIKLGNFDQDDKASFSRDSSTLFDLPQ